MITDPDYRHDIEHDDKALGSQVWQCAWCRRYFGLNTKIEVPAPIPLPKWMSHGVCPECKQKVLAQKWKPSITI